MTTLKTIELTCPNCQHAFGSPVVDLQDTRGRKHTDFHLQNEGLLQTLSFDVHLCARCGFAGPEGWFAERVTVSYEVRRHVWDELAPRVSPSAALSASEKYEFAAKVAMWDGAAPREVADLWLRAAWCCVDENDVEAERYYRRLAAWRFEEALESYDGIPREDRAAVTYLVGELWRRIGDSAKAKEWFDRVADAVTDARRQNWIVRAAQRQRDDPGEWFV